MSERSTIANRVHPFGRTLSCFRWRFCVKGDARAGQPRTHVVEACARTGTFHDGVNTPSRLTQKLPIGRKMKTKLTHTRNSLSEKIRLQATALLQARLSDSIDLMMQAKQAHWNVKGPNFIALHELFDKVYTDAGVHVDLIAERIIQLGGIARGTVRVSAKNSSLAEYPLDITSGRKHVAELAHAIASYGELIRKAIALSTKLEDADTADIFTQVSRGTDMNLWFVEAHEQDQH